MRRLLLASAALLAPIAAMAQPAESTFPGINIQGTYLGPFFPQIPQAAPSTPAPITSTYFGAANDLRVGGQNSALTLGSGATTLLTDGTKSWWFI